MSAHFIPITLYADDDTSAWFGGISGYWAGIRAWYALVSTLDQNTDLYNELRETEGWVHPESIKEFADLIRDIDPATILLKNVDYLQGIPENQQEQWIRDCAARLKEVILDCAEKGRGILHFH